MNDVAEKVRETKADILLQYISELEDTVTLMEEFWNDSVNGNVEHSEICEKAHIYSRAIRPLLDETPLRIKKCRDRLVKLLCIMESDLLHYEDSPEVGMKINL